MKFYQKNWFIWFMLIFVPPLGAFFMWKSKKFHKIVKVLLTFAFLFWFLICGIVITEWQPMQTSDDKMTSIRTSSNENTNQINTTIKEKSMTINKDEAISKVKKLITSSDTIISDEPNYIVGDEEYYQFPVISKDDYEYEERYCVNSKTGKIYVLYSDGTFIPYENIISNSPDNNATNYPENNNNDSENQYNKMLGKILSNGLWGSNCSYFVGLKFSDFYTILKNNSDYSKKVFYNIVTVDGNKICKELYLSDKYQYYIFNNIYDKDMSLIYYIAVKDGIISRCGRMLQVNETKVEDVISLYPNIDINDFKVTKNIKSSFDRAVTYSLEYDNKVINIIGLPIYNGQDRKGNIALFEIVNLKE